MSVSDTSLPPPSGQLEIYFSTIPDLTSKENIRRHTKTKLENVEKATEVIADNEEKNRKKKYFQTNFSQWPVSPPHQPKWTLNPSLAPILTWTDVKYIIESIGNKEEASRTSSRQIYTTSVSDTSLRQPSIRLETYFRTTPDLKWRQDNRRHTKTKLKNLQKSIEVIVDSQ